MIPLSQFKKLLGSAAEGLSDEKIAHMRDAEYQLADIIIDFWLGKKKTGPEKKLPPQAG